jgi:hypothetical protein
MPVTPGKEGVKQDMERFKAGNLHSGKGGRVVTDPKQAIAISLSEAGMSNKRKAPRSSGRSSGRR